MAGQMDERYYDEKKGLALQSIADAAACMNEADALIVATKYAMPDLLTSSPD